MTEYERMNFATEVAFAALTESAQKDIPLKPVMGLMYLPDQAVTRQWQEACRAVIDLLRVQPEAPKEP